MLQLFVHNVLSIKFLLSKHSDSLQLLCTSKLFTIQILKKPMWLSGRAMLS